MARFTPEQCVAQRSPGRLVRRLAKLATAYVEDQFEGLDVSFAQWIALKVTDDGVVGNAGELARELGFTTGATTRMIDTLEERGLLTRQRCEDDRRVVKLFVTDSGRQMVREIQPLVVGSWNGLFEPIDQDEAEAFLRTLGKLFERAEMFAARSTHSETSDAL